MKLPEKKYEHLHNKELRSFARGWNSLILEIKAMNDIFDDECVKEALLKYKENVCKNVTIPFFKGVYDCILEIENLNKTTEGE